MVDLRDQELPIYGGDLEASGGKLYGERLYDETSERRHDLGRM